MFFVGTFKPFVFYNVLLILVKLKVINAAKSVIEAIVNLSELIIKTGKKYCSYPTSLIDAETFT